MRRSLGVAVAWTVGVAAVLGPIFLSLYIARRMSLSVEYGRLDFYAQGALRHAESTAGEQIRASMELESAHFPPCSPQEISLMRQIDLTSDYLQAVGRLSGNQLMCSSLGNPQPIDLGPVDFLFKEGTSLRTSVRLPQARGKVLMAAAWHGFVSFIDPSVPIDIPNPSNVSIGLFSTFTGHRIASSGPLPPHWRQAASAPASDFADGPFLVSAVRSSRFDIEVIAAAPQGTVDSIVRHYALFLVPIGILCGLALAGAVWYLSRIPLSMPGLLRAAARRNEFFVEYQPVVELASRRWVGAEALVRWRRNGEIIRPDAFISIAEDSGVISLITARVLAHVGADLPAIRRFSPDFRIGINLSTRDLQSPITLERLQDAVRASGGSPANLVVEVSERGLLEGEFTYQILSAIREFGMNIAIDDFGTGYSSLSRLGGLNLTHLKIDKSFVETIGTDSATSQVIPLIIQMAHTLNLFIVAEGVETEEQAQFLTAHGVHFAQGWLFARPMALQALLNRMAAAPPGSVYSASA